MTELRSDAELRKIAERRADAKIGFRNHALIYGLVNAGLAALNLATSPQTLWFVWPLFGWGIGLAAHGLAVYGAMGAGREQAVQAEMERLRRRR
jgi:hypothetical protein